MATATIGKLSLGLGPLHMAGMLAPLVMFRLLTFNKFPFAPTMEGSTS